MSIADLAALSESANSKTNLIPASHLLLAASPSLSRNIASTNGLRKGNLQQGRALEILGHALEYLQDSRMFLIDEPVSRSDAEAVQILASLSRTIFAECAEVKPFNRRWRDWIVGRPANVAVQSRYVR